MKKRLFYAMLGLFALIVAFTFSAFAESGKKSGLFTYEIKGNGTAIIIGFDWKSNGNKDVYIPRTLDGYMVTEIGELAFSSSSASLETLAGKAVLIVVPDTITIIGDKAFFCTQITSINIPSSVKLIGGGAFAGCPNIRQFSVDSGNQVYTTIDGVLYNKTAKELVAYPLGKELVQGGVIAVPEGILSIADYAFYSLKLDYNVYSGINWWHLITEKQSVALPNSITRIGNYAFAECELNFSDHIEVLSGDFGEEPFALPLSLVSVGDYAFYNSKVCKITLPDTLKKIGKYAFGKALVWTHFERDGTQYGFELPNNVVEIGEGAFADITQKRYCFFDLSHSKVKTIPSFAFRGVYLGNLILPTTLEEIQTSAFEDALGVTTIPKTVKVIADRAFKSGGGNIKFEDGATIEEIGHEAFFHYHFNGQETLNLPNGLLEIGYCAFDNTTDLSLLVIPGSVIKIGEPLCDRAEVTLQVESGSYAAIFASENGYTTKKAGGDDTSWLNS